jgi:uncharacterized membrane protein
MRSADVAPHPEKATQRIEAFSDGVFAIAITLLIIEIKVPDLRQLLDPRLSVKFVSYLTRLYTISNCLYLLAIIISLFNPNAAIIVTIILALLYLLPPKKPQYE